MVNRKEEENRNLSIDPNSLHKKLERALLRNRHQRMGTTGKLDLVSRNRNQNKPRMRFASLEIFAVLIKKKNKVNEMHSEEKETVASVKIAGGIAKLTEPSNPPRLANTLLTFAKTPAFTVWTPIKQFAP